MCNTTTIIPLWILDELFRILVYLKRAKSSSSSTLSKFEQEQYNFILQSIFPIYLCGTKQKTSSSSSSNNSSVVVAAALTDINRHNEKNFHLLIRSLLPFGCSEILLKITSEKDLEKIFTDLKEGRVIARRKSSNVSSTDDNSFTMTTTIVQLPFYEKLSSTSKFSAQKIDVKIQDFSRREQEEQQRKKEEELKKNVFAGFKAYSDDEDEDGDGDTTKDIDNNSSSSAKESRSFQISRSDYDFKTFTSEQLVKKNLTVKKEQTTRVVSCQVCETDDNDDTVSVASSFSATSTTRNYRSTHVGCDVIIDSDFSESSNSSTTSSSSSSSSASQFELLMKHPEFTSMKDQRGTTIKFEVFDLSSSLEGQWCPFIIPVEVVSSGSAVASSTSSSSIRSFLHRTLLLPPFPLLHSNNMLSSMSKLSNLISVHHHQNAISMNKKKGDITQQQQKRNIQKDSFDSTASSDEHSVLSLAALVRQPVSSSSASTNSFEYYYHKKGSPPDAFWISAYLSIFTIWNWIATSSFSDEFKREAKDVLLIGNTNNNTDSSSNIIIQDSRIQKLQKILTLCDATKSGKYADSFLNREVEIGSVEAILALRYLTTRKEVKDPFDRDNDDIDTDELFEFRTVRFEVNEDYYYQDKGDESSILLVFSIPKVFQRMIVNHFDKVASPVFFQIELSRTCRRVFTLIGVRRATSTNNSGNNNNNNNQDALSFLLVDHVGYLLSTTTSSSESAESVLRWYSPSDLIVELIANMQQEGEEEEEAQVQLDAGNEEEKEEFPIACTFIFPVLSDYSVL